MTLLGAGPSSPRVGEKAPHAPPKRAHLDVVGVAGSGGELGASPGEAAIEDFPWQRVSPLPRFGAGGSGGAAAGEQRARAVSAGGVLRADKSAAEGQGQKRWLGARAAKSGSRLPRKG